MEYSRQQAAEIAAKVSPEVGLDPTVIISLLLPLFQNWLNCLNDNDDTSAAHVKERVTYLHSKDPARLQRRVEKSIRRKHRDMDSEQVTAIAKATISHIIESDEDAPLRVYQDL